MAQVTYANNMLCNIFLSLLNSFLLAFILHVIYCIAINIRCSYFLAFVYI
nr:MAG TPA: hypothetical protein [Caudoviricetes sp.]